MSDETLLSPAKLGDPINEFRAAALVGMSPELLRWFTQYAPKQGDPRKLPVAKVKDGIIYFDETELVSFNEWLKLPWPHKDGKRPRTPDGIRREIQNEANGACAICNTHRDSCEAAHLDPVAKSKNNHPENLLWLCRNHHKPYDDGLFGPDDENAAFVSGFKIYLHRYKKMLWDRQDEGSRMLFLALENCKRIAEQSKGPLTDDQRIALEAVAKENLALIPRLAPVSKEDPNYTAYCAIAGTLGVFNAGVSQGKDISASLEEARVLHEHYVAALGFVPCRCCNATGSYLGSDCPVCHGDREIDEEIDRTVDLSQYALVKCPACNGKGSRNGVDCSECIGDKEMQRQFADKINPKDFELVECPICHGSGHRRGEDCLVCKGDKEIERHIADQTDPRDFDLIDCPICDGSGRRDGDDCRACHGDKLFDRHYAKTINPRDFEKVDCPVCDGNGHREGEDCPECKGNKIMDREFAEKIDKRLYEKVKCTACQGTGDRKGNECNRCNGAGKLERRFLS